VVEVDEQETEDNLPIKRPQTVAEVAEWATKLLGPAEALGAAATFREHQVDGASLLALDKAGLKEHLGITAFGTLHKLATAIEALRPVESRRSRGHHSSRKPSGGQNGGRQTNNGRQKLDERSVRATAPGGCSCVARVASNGDFKSRAHIRSLKNSFAKELGCESDEVEIEILDAAEDPFRGDATDGDSSDSEGESQRNGSRRGRASKFEQDSEDEGVDDPSGGGGRAADAAQLRAMLKEVADLKREVQRRGG
jgi:hypothetical protein